MGLLGSVIRFGMFMVTAVVLGTLNLVLRYFFPSVKRAIGCYPLPKEAAAGKSVTYNNRIV